LGLPTKSWKASVSKLATAAIRLPSGEIEKSSTPLPGFEMSVTNLPFQSLASGENAFLDLYCTMPKKLPVLAPSA